MSRITSVSALAAALVLTAGFAFPATSFAAITAVTDQASLVAAIADTGTDTITFSNDITVSSAVVVDRAVTIDGGNHKLNATFSNAAKDTSNNAALIIIASNVTVENLVEDGTGSVYLHGINVYEATGVNLDSVTVSNNPNSGLVVNGSTVVVNNITTSGNGWNGINVDQGKGVSTPASLTVNGTSHHTETPAIWIDDNSKTVSVIDTNSQYYSYAQPYVDSLSVSYVGTVYTLPKTLTVSGSGACTVVDPNCSTIQAAINAANNGDKIVVPAGTFDAFKVDGKKDISIAGAGAGITNIVPSALISTGVTHKYTANIQASVFVNGSTNVALSGMTIEDNGSTPGAGGPDALVFWNASTGSIENSALTASYTISGAQTGQGIAVDASGTDTSTLAVTNTDISGFQKNGIEAIDGNGAASGNTDHITVTVTGGSISGAGMTGTIAQNGFVVWNRGGGTVSGSINGTTIQNFEFADHGVSEGVGAYVYGGGTFSSIANAIFKNDDLYIVNGNSTAIAATGNSFDGVASTGATNAELGGIEDKIADDMNSNTFSDSSLDGVGPVEILTNARIATPNGKGIAAAVTAAGSGGTVYVAPGNYTENITASSPVTILGPNASVNPVTGTRSGEATVTGMISLYAGDSTVKGLTVTNPSYSGSTIKGIYVYSDGPVNSNIDIENNILSNIANSAAHGSYGVMVQGELNNITVSNNVFDGITSLGWAHALEVTPTGTDTTVPTSVTVEGNKFQSVTGDNGDSYAFSVDASGSVLANASQVSFTHNDIESLNVRNLDTAHTLDASNNYWGADAAPTAQVDAQTGFFPWCTDATCTTTVNGSTDTVVVDSSWSGASMYDKETVGSTDYYYGVNAFSTIGDGIAHVDSGGTVSVAAGTYAENVTVNKKLTLQGAGSGGGPSANTIVSTGSGNGITVAASGASASDRLTIKNIRVTGDADGLIIDSAVSFVTLDHVALVSNTGYGIEIHNSAVVNDLSLTNVTSTGNAVGFRVATTGSVNGLTVTNSSFDNNSGQGMYTNASGGSTTNQNNFTNISVTGTTFSGNGGKGVYLEKADHATFDGITIDGSGTSAASGSGFNVNLKYGDYQQITLENSTISNSGTGDTSEGTGVNIEARDDGSYASKPATLDGVTLTNNTITGNQVGLRFGETGKGNAGPTNVVLRSNKVTGSISAGFINETTASEDAAQNWWGSATGPTVASNVNTSTGDSITGDVAYRPWCTDSTCGTVDTSSVSATGSVDTALAKAGTVVTATVVFNKTMNTAIAPVVDAIFPTAGATAFTQTSYSGDTWTGTVSVPDGENGTVNVEVAGAEDPYGNQLSGTSTPTSFTADTTAPVIDSIVSDANSSGALKIGDTINFELMTHDTESGASVTGSYNGHSLAWASDNGGISQKATYTVTSGDADQTSALQITGVTITDAAGNTSDSFDGSDVQKTIDANAPLITTTVSQTPFSPNGDSVKDTTDIDTAFSEDSHYAIYVEDASHTVMKSWTGDATNPNAKTWDGTDSSNATVADGTYTVVVAATDAAGNTTTDSSQTIVVDNTAPTITLTAAADGNTDMHLALNNTYTDPGYAASDTLDGDISGSVVVGGDTVDTSTAGAYVVTYDVSDAAGNPATQVTRTVTVEDSGVTLTTTTNGDGTETGTVGSEFTGTSSTATTTASFEIPAGTTVTGTAGWNGVVNLPTVTTSYTAPSGDATTTHPVAAAIEIGSSDHSLTFSTPVKIVFSGQTGQRVGWSFNSGAFTEITNTCDSNSSSTTVNGGSTFPTGGDCKIDVGGDLVVWTEHFTTFISFGTNHIPVASDVSASPTRGVSTDIGLTVTDADSDALTYSIVSGPSHGSVTIASSTLSTATYTSTSGYVGSDSFTYKANDGTDDSNTATVSLNVTGGSGGGGGGGGSSATPATPASPNGAGTPATPATPATPSSNAGGEVLGASAYNFAHDLHKGSSGTDVTELQKFLIAAGFDIPAITKGGQAYGFFGGQTLSAVVAYQKAQGITPSAGYVGVITRNLLNKGVVSKTPEHATNLTTAQANSIIAILESFGADPSVVANVKASLGL